MSVTGRMTASQLRRYTAALVTIAEDAVARATVALAGGAR